jgi:Acetyltransferase (GNAT) family.
MLKRPFQRNDPFVLKGEVMPLEFLRVDHASSDQKQIDRIMKEQFPSEEYLSIDEQLALQDQGEIEVWGLYEEKTLVGLTTLRTTSDVAYLFFLAFDHPYQGKGYGKEAMKEIQERYPEKLIAVDFELADQNAKNNEQRQRRKRFYAACGFTETGWGLSYLGVNYEIAAMNKPFDIARFKAMLNPLPIEGFHPRYFSLRP